MSFRRIFVGGGGVVPVDSGGDLPHAGVIYAVTPDGRLLWYRDDDRRGRNGADAERGWAPGSGNQIGRGW